MTTETKQEPGGGGGGIGDGPMTDIALHLECTRLRAENRRLVSENEKLSNSNNAAFLLRLERAENTILHQQIELTKLNRAINRKNRRIQALLQQNGRYRDWAQNIPIDADHSFMNTLERRIGKIHDTNVRTRRMRNVTERPHAE